jgi:outer membrane protein assembly factor BamA
VRLVKVEIEGNVRTKKHIIRHAAKPAFAARTFGQLMQELHQLDIRLQQLEIFESAQIYVDTDSNRAPDEVSIVITVKEKNCTTLKTGTYVNAENAEGNMEGLYILRNFFGTAERFELSTAMGTSHSNNFKLDCHKPTLNGTDVSLHGQINRASMQFPHSSYHEHEHQVNLLPRCIWDVSPVEWWQLACLRPTW